MAATKQYTQVKTAEKPLPPKPLLPQQQQNVLPIILAQNPSSSSPQALPVLVQSSDGHALQMGYPHSAPNQHYIYAQPSVEDQVTSFRPGSYSQTPPNQMAVRTRYSPPRHDQEGSEAGTSYPHPRLASFNREPSLPDGSEGRSSITENTTYPLVQYFSMPTPGSSPQSALATQLQNYEFPPGHQRDRRLSSVSSNGFELPSGARRRRRYSRTNPAYSYDPLEASDVETDETPGRSSRSNRPSLTHRREDSFPPPSRQFQHHRERRNSSIQDPALQGQTQVNQRRSRGKSLSVPGQGMEFEKEEHITTRRARSPSSHRPRLFKRRSNSLPDDQRLAVPEHTHTSHHRSRHHRYSTAHGEAAPPSFGPRSRAVSMINPATAPEEEPHGHRRRSRKNSDHRSSRSKSRARGKSRIRSKSTSYQPSDSDDYSSSDYERPDNHLRDYLPSALKTKGGDSNNPYNKRNTVLGGLGGAVLGNALFPGVGTALGPAAGAVMGGMGGHELGKDGGMEGSRQRGEDRAKEKWKKKQREWEAGRKAGEEEGRRMGMEMARKRAEMKARVERRERGGTSMGGVGGGGG